MLEGLATTAGAALEAAVALFERKGAASPARQARALLAALPYRRFDYPSMGAAGQTVTARLPARANLRAISVQVRREEQEMTRKHFRFKTLVLGLALGLAFAVVPVPTASAKPVSTDVLNGGLDPWAVSLVYKSTHPSTTQADLTALDPWAVNLVYKAAQSGAAPTTTPAVDVGPLDPWAYNLVYQSRHSGSSTVGDTAIKVPNSSSGFDFGDAGIGAAVSFGAALILMAAIGFGLRQRRIHRSRLAVS